MSEYPQALSADTQTKQTSEMADEYLWPALLYVRQLPRLMGWLVGVVAILILAWYVCHEILGLVWLPWVGLEGQTLWDIAKVAKDLVVPVSVAFGVWFLTEVQRRSEVVRNRAQWAHDVRVSRETRQSLAHRDYLDRMWIEPKSESVETGGAGHDLSLARARTLLLFQELDAARKRAIVEYLWESRAIVGPQPQLKMARADLSHVDLSGLELTAVNLVKADLTQSVFCDSESVAQYAHLTGATLREADFRGANLEKGRLESTLVEATKFQGANLKSACLKECKAPVTQPGRAAVFCEADLSYADFTFTVLPYANFESAHVDAACFDQAVLNDARFGSSQGVTPQFVGAQLERASFSPNVHYTEPVFQNAMLVDVDFSGASLWGAKFEDADMRGALLVGCQLTKAVFRGAKLTNADFHDAILDEADLVGSGISQEQLANARSCRDVRLRDEHLEDAEIRELLNA